MMRAVRLIAAGRPLANQEVAIPEPGPEDVLIRVGAAGICHSDAHYRAGRSPTGPTPLTLGHEIAGTIAVTGERVFQYRPGDRVCVHYLATCGGCIWCRRGHEQFCATGRMIGKHRDGGWAEFVGVPARCVVALPEAVSFEHGAVLMCSSATSLHALRKARLQPGESVAIFGIGGLGASAVQLARGLGASAVYAVDVVPAKLELARRFGAIPVHAREDDPVAAILRQTGGRGVDVSLELIGLPATMAQAVRVVGVLGRAVLAGLTPDDFSVSPYAGLINKEAEIIGVSDHVLAELPELIEFVVRGQLDLSPVVTRCVALDAGPINQVLDELEHFAGAARTVISMANLVNLDQRGEASDQLSRKPGIQE